MRALDARYESVLWSKEPWLVISVLGYFFVDAKVKHTMQQKIIPKNEP
jgi:hypothetical protein